MSSLRESHCCSHIEQTEHLPEDVPLDLILDLESVEYRLKTFGQSVGAEDYLVFGLVAEASASSAPVAVEFVQLRGEGIIYFRCDYLGDSLPIHLVRSNTEYSDYIRNMLSDEFMHSAGGFIGNQTSHAGKAGVRFLDLKKDRNGRRKKRYAPIYNKYVYGYIKSGIWKWLNAHIPGMLARTIQETFK